LAFSRSQVFVFVRLLQDTGALKAAALNEALRDTRVKTALAAFAKNLPNFSGPRPGDEHTHFTSSCHKNFYCVQICYLFLK